jgi:hypothetical protein
MTKRIVGKFIGIEVESVMTIEEQRALKREKYPEAMLYIANAKDALQKAGRDGRYFKSKKYVRSASGIAYSGVLVAVEAWLQMKDVKVPEAMTEKNQRKSVKSVDFYRNHLKDLDKKLLQDFNSAYYTLHLCGYCDGVLLIKTIEGGFEIAMDIINRIKPHREAL